MLYFLIGILGILVGMATSAVIFFTKMHSKTYGYILVNNDDPEKELLTWVLEKGLDQLLNERLVIFLVKGDK